MAVGRGGKKEEEQPAGAFVVPQTQKDSYRPILRAASRPAALFSVKGCGCADSASAGFIGKRLLGSEMPGAVQTAWRDQPVQEQSPCLGSRPHRYMNIQENFSVPSCAF